jgi:hypothetical protein
MDLAIWETILPEGIRPSEGPPVPPPPDYEDGFVLPEHSVKPLAEKGHGKHAMDDNLAFYEVPHVYTYQGVPTMWSGSGLAHKYETPFVAMEGIKAMKFSKSQVYPRKEYILPCDDGETWSPSAGALLVRDGKSISIAPPYSLGGDEEEMRSFLYATALGGATESQFGDEVVLYRRGLEDKEIETMWKQKGQQASHRGTDAHWQAECYFNGLPCRWWQEEMQPVFRFAREQMVPRGLVSLSTEKEIVCPDANVAGSIDLLVRCTKTGVIHIVDHKRSEKLRMQLRGYKKMRPPFQHLDDCKGAAYALQTSVYQYILERDYGMQVGDRVLLSLHPDLPDFATSVPYLKEEASFLMETCIETTRAHRALAAREERFRCALTGGPLVDAVRLPDGRVAAEKAALVAEIVGAPPDEELRSLFKKAVDEEVTLPTLPKGLCPWRARMPAEGIAPFL